MTRSQNARNAESTSHGNVAQKRYKGMDHRGHLAVLGQGWTTGHQNRKPVPKKHACSNSCNQFHLNASANTEGTCHPIKAKVAASQQMAGWVARRPNLFTKPKRR